MKGLVIRNILLGMLVFILGGLSMYLIISFDNETENVVNILESNDENIVEGVNNIYDATLTIKNMTGEFVNKSGTGFIYKQDGDAYYIITNDHVIVNADKIEVDATNGKSYVATLLQGDKYNDLAVLEIDTEDELLVATMGTSEDMKLGQTVFTIGSPVNSVDYTWTVNKGIVSHLYRYITVDTSDEDYGDYELKTIQMDSVINQGNSGGPLSNVDGEVVGVNTRKLIMEGVEGLFFAVPIEDAIRFADIVISGEEFFHSSLGFVFFGPYENYWYDYPNVDVPDNFSEGVLVALIYEDGVADGSGLEVSDIITELNDKNIENQADFRQEMFRLEKGSTASLTVLRGGETLDIEIVVE